MHYDKMCKEIEKATQQIKGQVEVIRFADNMQAFFYNLGKYTLPSFVALILIAVISFFYSKSQAYNQIIATLNSYQNAPYYQGLISRGNLEEMEGNVYLVLKPTSKFEVMKIGQEYHYDKSNNASYILLGSKNRGFMSISTQLD